MYELNNEELDEVLQIVLQQHGYDFTDYSTASIKRRVSRFMELTQTKDIFELKYNLINRRDFFPFFLQNVTVNVTEMFRDPDFYKDIRSLVIPLIAAYPIIKIWHAGCATGEEVFSMCILLEEAGLLNRTYIYATDINPANLIKAKQGIIPLSAMKSYTQNYHQSGGLQDFSDYYTARYDNAIIDKRLTRKIIFSRHNLATESSFNEFQLIICRNVLIYFNRGLQRKVFHLLYDSLVPKGFLALGLKESLLFSGMQEKFEAVNGRTKIYKRKM